MKSSTIEIRTKGFGLMTLFISAWTIGVWIMVGVLLIGMIGRPSEIKSLWFLWLAMIGIGLLTGNHIIFQTFGKVKITLTHNRIHLINVNSLFRNEVDIPINDFKRLIYLKEDNFGTGGIFGFTSGNIVLYYNGGQRRFGKGLNAIESIKVIRQIENEIKNSAQQ